MPSWCCVPQCTNSSDNGYSFFHFPKQKDRKDEWLKMISRCTWTPKPHHVVCEVHFDPSMVEFVGKRKELRGNAVPTLVCHCETQKCTGSSTLGEHQILVTAGHTYAPSQVPTRKPLGGLQICATPQQLSMKSTIAYNGKENSIPKKRRRTRLTHFSTCPLNHPPLQPPPPPAPHPLPKTPSAEEVQRLLEENARLEKQVSSLLERAELVNKVISNDQLIALKLGGHRGYKWSTESLIEGLSLKFSCGAVGYQQLRKRMPLPGTRTLRRCMQKINFEPGVLDVVFKCLENEVPKMRLIDRDCVIVLDGMSIQPRLDMDRSTGCYIGNVTVPHGLGSECACKAMVFMVNGLAKRYKQVVLYHFCGSKNNTDGTVEALKEVLQRCENVGLNVVAIVCDMGNRAALSKLGFSFKSDGLVYKVPNPANPAKTLYVVPDCVHIFKSVKEMLSRTDEIILPDDIVAHFKLPSKVVKMDLIEWLEEEQAQSMLQFAPKLKKTDMHPTHFKKMKVSTATNVISPQVGGALMHMGKKNENPAMVTTGWFIKKLRRWFTIVTSRSTQFALSLRNKEAYEDAISVMQLMCDIFEKSSFGSSWKVTQTHIIMASKALLEIQSVLLGKGYSYVCLGNLTQDSIENLFSSIRIQRPKPSALDFKFRLKQYVFGKIAVKATNSSYSHNDAPSLISLLTMAKNSSNCCSSASSADKESSLIFPQLDTCPDIREDEKDILYRMGGYVVHKMKKKLRKCQLCFESLLHQEDVPHRYAGLTVETDITSCAQVRIANHVFKLFLAIERLLVASLHLLPKMRPGDKEALTKHIASSVQEFQIYRPLSPACPGSGSFICADPTAWTLRRWDGGQHLYVFEFWPLNDHSCRWGLKQ